MNADRFGAWVRLLATTPSRRALIGATLGSLWALPARRTAATPVAPAPPAVATPSRRPNIILVLLDDLDAQSVDQMPVVVKVLRNQGATFANFFVTTPICGPSRASILRGQYAHNHRVLMNVKSRLKPGGFPTFHEAEHEDATMATWLHDAGYRTALVGKYLNQYPEGADPGYVPPGWDEWYAEVRGQYFNYQLNENGTVVHYGTDPKDYQTDVLARKASSFVRRSAQSGKPFFLYLAPHAPHTPATPAPRHAKAFADATAPRVSSFNEAHIDDKPAWVRAGPSLSADEIARIDELHRQRLRSLLAVNDMVAALIDDLSAADALDNTYILLTSDNGFHHGEHRLPGGKGDPYQESIRVPLLARGPGVAASRVVEELALNVDLAPTVAALAGTTAPSFVDGRSLAPLLAGEPPTPWRQMLVVELFGGGKRVEAALDAATAQPDAPAEPDDESDPAHRPELPVPPYQALRTADLLYVEYATREREVYNLRTDPHELENLAQSVDPATLEHLAVQLAGVRNCAMTGCRAAEDRPLALVGIG